MQMMNYNNLLKHELLQKCDELGIKKCKSKTKKQLIDMINMQNAKIIEAVGIEAVGIEAIGIEAVGIEAVGIEAVGIEEDVCIMQESDKVTLIDLFSGTGAFSLAFHNTGKVRTIFANDMLDSSEQIFNLNNKIKLMNKNLNEIDDSSFPKCQILTAGFPCQPFSIAGMQKGFDDERSNVFWKILSIIKSTSPDIVILENVKNLQRHDDGNTFNIIIENLENLEYNIKYSILNTCKLTGIPQNRERIYIVCFKNLELFNKFDFDFQEVEIMPITMFLENDIPDKYYYSNSSTIYEELRTNITKHITTNTIYQYRRYYVRENKTNVCPTLTANMGSGGHNVPIILDDNGIRKLTPKECFNLQGFPDTYKLPNLSNSKLYSLAGNAVSVPVVELIANKIINIM
jgi:DNA (cytosine-5)-methyltransferase 1